MTQSREAQVRTRRVRLGGPSADAQWFSVTADSNLLDDTRDWTAQPIRSVETDLHAEAAVQSMGRHLWGVWTPDADGGSSLYVTRREKANALIVARDLVTAKVLPAQPVEPDPEPVHCGACSSHIHHHEPMPGCHACYEEAPMSQAAETAQTVTESLEGTISLRPSDEGFAMIAGRFATQILIDVSNKRRESDRLLMDSLIEMVAYLAQTDPKLVAQLRDEIMRRTR